MIIQFEDKVIQCKPKELQNELLDAVSVLSYIGDTPTLLEGGKGCEKAALHALSLAIFDKVKMCFPSGPPPLLQLLLRTPKTLTKDEVKTFYQSAKAIALFMVRAGDYEFNVKSIYTSFNEKSVEKLRHQEIKTSAAPSPTREIGRYLLLQISKELVRPKQLLMFLSGGRASGFTMSGIDVKKALRGKTKSYIEVFLYVEEGVESEHIIKNMVRRDVLKAYADLTSSYSESDIGSFEVRFSEWFKDGKAYCRIERPGEILTKAPPLAARVKKT